MDCLVSAEMAATNNGLRGPAASSEAWPLDGHISGFELTPANEEAYYMHVAIRRTAAASRAAAAAAAEAAAGEGDGSPGGKKRARGKDSGTTGEAGNGEAAAGRGGGGEGGGEDVSPGATAVAVAAFAASSAALLFSRGEMDEEESLLRDSLSAYKAQEREHALR